MAPPAALQVKDQRQRYKLEDEPGFEEIPDDREPSLYGFTSAWDLNMFKEAQAMAAEDVENSLRGMPDTKVVKYIEMGRHEMEVRKKTHNRLIKHP